MNGIRLYQAGKVDITIKFPENWDELLPVELLGIADIQLKEGLSKPAIFMCILNERLIEAKSKIDIDLLEKEDLVLYGLPLLDFIFAQNTLTKPAEELISIGNLKLYGPAAAFEKITCGEYEDAEQAFYAFLEATKLPDADGTETLADLASILYRTRGQLYSGYNHKQGNWIYDRTAAKKALLNLEAHRLYAIFLWYTGCRSMLPKVFPVMHEPGEDGEANNGHPAMNFVKCIHAGAGIKNGSRDNIRSMKLLEFLFDMEQEAIKAKELKEFYEQQQHK